MHMVGEHHAALQVLGDVAMHHPGTWVGHLYQDVHRLAGAHEHGVLPGQVLVANTVAASYQETLPMEVDGVLHGVIRIGGVPKAHADLLSGCWPPPSCAIPANSATMPGVLSVGRSASASLTRPASTSGLVRRVKNSRANERSFGCACTMTVARGYVRSGVRCSSENCPA